MQTIELRLTDYEHKKLQARAARALLPLAQYITAAAADPIKFAWADDALDVPATSLGGRKTLKD